MGLGLGGGGGTANGASYNDFQSLKQRVDDLQVIVRPEGIFYADKNIITNQRMTTIGTLIVPFSGTALPINPVISLLSGVATLFTQTNQRVNDLQAALVILQNQFNALRVRVESQGLVAPAT